MQFKNRPTPVKPVLLDYIIMSVLALGAGCIGWILKNIANLIGMLIVSVLVGGTIAFFSSFTFWPTVSITFVVIFAMQWLASRSKRN